MKSLNLTFNSTINWFLGYELEISVLWYMWLAMLGCTFVQKCNLFGNKQGSNFGESANCKIDSTIMEVCSLCFTCWTVDHVVWQGWGIFNNCKFCQLFLIICCHLQVMMKDISTPVPAEEFRKEIRSCLHQAALVNYTRVSTFAKIEGDS